MKVPKLTWQPFTNLSIAKTLPTVTSICPAKDILLSIITPKSLIESTRSRMIPPNMYKNSIGWRSLENVIDLHWPRTTSLFRINKNKTWKYYSIEHIVVILREETGLVWPYQIGLKDQNWGFNVPSRSSLFW
jgi:hypothetical protein